MTNYNWVILQLDTVPQEEDLNDVVKTVHWRRSASEVNGEETLTVESYGSMGCATPSATDFTAYPDLTQAQVEGWLEAGLDVAAIDAGLQSQIDNLINPPIVNLPLPWENNG